MIIKLKKIANKYLDYLIVFDGSVIPEAQKNLIFYFSFNETNLHFLLDLIAIFKDKYGISFIEFEIDNKEIYVSSEMEDLFNFILF